MGDARVRILAYAARLSGRPGEAVEIKVSCEGLNRYEAELVRIIQGDINPQGPGYREDAVDLDLGGPFEGRFQPLHPGSYGIVEDNAERSRALSEPVNEAFTVACGGRRVLGVDSERL